MDDFFAIPVSSDVASPRGCSVSLFLWRGMQWVQERVCRAQCAGEGKLSI
jgi:hypothetical protein